MDINQVLEVYDSMFGRCSLEQIDAFLESSIEEAAGEGDISSVITLVNEMIGFCRDTSQREKGIGYCSQLIALMRNLEMEGSVPFATSALNIGNAYRAFGLLEESMECYQTVEAIYENNLDKHDFRYASLYNNWSLLYQEMGEFEHAEQALKKALAVVLLYEDAKTELATTHTNLAATLLRMGKSEEAAEHLEQALAIYEAEGGKDFHYSAALSAMGDACYLSGKPEEAVRYYDRAMQELEKHVGRTEAYERIAENRKQAAEAAEQQKKEEAKKKEKAEADAQREAEETEAVKEQRTDRMTEKQEGTESNLARCREFYESCGAPMIHALFPEYEQQIAVGLAGEGSDCFGYEDELSKDHDFGLGFCMWIPEELNWTIGEPLQKAYEELLIKAEGKREQETLQGKHRHGVMTIGAFYSHFLNQSAFPDSLEKWAQIPEGALAAATNGEVFRDDAGIFSAVRRRLQEYYPEEVFRCRLAEEVTYFSQYGQYNYSRMMARQDYVTAKISLAEWMKHTMKLVYLLNRTYEPYYKWLRRGIKSLPILPEIGDILDAVADMPEQREAWKNVAYDANDVNGADQIALTIDIVARYLLAELQRQGLTTGEDTYLASHAEKILTGGQMQAQRRKNSFETRMTAEEKAIKEMTAEEKAPEEKTAEEAVRKNAASEKTAEDEKKTEHKEKEKSGLEELVMQIVRLEWKQFDGVKNEGGRADCQDDWNTFQIMRKSQYLAWPKELLESYLADLVKAEKTGWNLIMEKYARMMESTAPEKYERFKHFLPERDFKRILLQEEIIKIQVAWMEEFAALYPLMAGNSRSIHTAEDTPWNTSYETYLRGELGTYSARTLELYGRFIVALARQDRNLAYMIMDNTARLYGYESVEDAEEKLR